MSRVTKTICDRCGKEIVTNADMFVIKIMFDCDVGVERELCAGCMDKLGEWFGNGRKDGDGDG